MRPTGKKPRSVVPGLSAHIACSDSKSSKSSSPLPPSSLLLPGLVGKLEYTEENGAVSAEGEAFFVDADLVLLQYAFEHIRQLDMRNGFEGKRALGTGRT
jgi:hypothetical protein